mmetsp:Transcript_20434/g.29934  ORF Transcript_20434/g.29934 Transcript_20434/m.29934 type:complete len:208 (-) Transcript_20434:1003-1626(-)
MTCLACLAKSNVVVLSCTMGQRSHRLRRLSSSLAMAIFCNTAGWMVKKEERFCGMYSLVICADTCSGRVSERGRNIPPFCSLMFFEGVKRLAPGRDKLAGDGFPSIPMRGFKGASRLVDRSDFVEERRFFWGLAVVIDRVPENLQSSKLDLGGRSSSTMDDSKSTDDFTSSVSSFMCASCVSILGCMNVPEQTAEETASSAKVDGSV